MLTFEALEQAVNRDCESDILLPPDAGLCHWPKVNLDARAAEKFLHGNPVISRKTEGMLRVYGPDEVILGLGEASSDGVLRPRRVFVIK